MDTRPENRPASGSRTTGWQFWVDRGGTFTDVIGRRPDGHVAALKLLSVMPGQYEDATATGIRRLLAVYGASEEPVEVVRVGTTVATNALLERRGGRLLLVTHRGLGDALAIGTQERPELFKRRIELPTPLYASVLEVAGRIDADGTRVEPLDEDALKCGLRDARAAGFDSVAIVFMHAWRDNRLERNAARLAREAGFEAVVTSHEIAPIEGYIPRGQTAVAEAFLALGIQNYIATLTRELSSLGPATRVELMQSHGGLAPAAAFRGTNGVLSGPAGGLVGMVRTGTAAGFARLIGFDMGGTSTDVSLYDGSYARRSEVRIAGIRLAVPALDVHTVAAGGGSLLRYRDGRYVVGPASAGAVPGPASYGRGGPLALTDCHVLLGRLPPTHLPTVFGQSGDAPLDVEPVTIAFARLVDEVRVEHPNESMETIAEGFLTVAVDTMATAIKEISLKLGRDPADFALACFGGAGGQLACRVADALDIRQVVIHPLAGVLSAVGIGLAERRVLQRGTFEHALDTEGARAAQAHGQALAERARRSDQELVGAALTLLAEIRVASSDVALAVPMSDAITMRRAFLDEHARRFGYSPDPASDLVIAAVSAELVGPAGDLPRLATTADPQAPTRTTRAWFEDRWQDIPVVVRNSLPADTTLVGPALVIESTSTTIVEPGWAARHGADGVLTLERVAARRARPKDPAVADPVLLEVFNGLYTHVAEQMGAVLRQTASSVNIRERLDYSCAVFDGDGRLVANAPHMPVHLGSMGASVRFVMARHAGKIEPGDAYLVNSPYAGGTHLPDLTVVSPVYLEGDRAPSFWVAARAHHADIGGITPGSMPPFSRSIEEEGALFDGERIVCAGRFDTQLVGALLTRGPHPTRNLARNLADLAAQLAATHRGARELARLTTQYGRDVVSAYLRHVQTHAERRVRSALRALPIAGVGAVRHERELDGGERIVVTLEIDANDGTVLIDFTGTSPQTSTNFNAPKAVCTAAVLYVLRTLVDDDMPLNEGCLAPLRLVIPVGSLLDPQPPAAVVAGNVETSQAIVDLLYGALGVLADSQGTMNNLTFGDADCQYYETIAGGAGAGPDFDGASGVQTHMTNSRLTDPEIFESRLPVRLLAFHYRHGSGGHGRHRGGDGLVREIGFKRALNVAILSNHRRLAPRGLAGGGEGARGRTTILRADGTHEDLPACAECRVAMGDSIRIETPGGGGYGASVAAPTQG
jgi:5-oxoprolinase (ATP-hydrolysing)